MAKKVVKPAVLDNDTLLKIVGASQALQLRQTCALEKIARCLGDVCSYLDRIVDGNGGTLKVTNHEKN